MNYFKAAEQDLSSIPVLKRSLENLKKRKERLLNSGCPSENVIIDYTKPYVDSSFVNETLNDLIQLSQVNKEIANTEAKIAEFDDVINQLDKEHKTIITMWYIEKQSKEAIADKMHFQKRDSIYSLRNKAVAQYALLYYGANALNSI
ncbi:MAG: hypothetical protein A2Y15_08650 [Clostridiales bacterium GWF2_36_10]|nr:MAG: hypothetical protein A2Y15_08650 [Clostridiales bacterium GWF2_36_10]HAN20412.1 hypothetical protein [Clostridiales bacterium]